MAMKPLDDTLDVNHEINVTPFIDVVLVLLIIFMVAAPLATVNVPVNLPSTASQQQVVPKKPLYLTLQLDHSLLLGDTRLAQDQLVPALERATAGDHEQRIYIRADKGLVYGELMALLGRLQKADFTQVALVGVSKD
jgi:TonB system transport protein ExbD (group 1)